MASVSERFCPSPQHAADRPAAIDKALDVELFKALGDPTRVRLLACLSKCGRACSVSEVAACCEIDFSVVARHLSALSRAGVLASEKRGRRVMYRLCARDLCVRLRGLADAIEEWVPECDCDDERGDGPEASEGSQ